MKTKVLWFTGLSGSGKSTISEKLLDVLEAKGARILVLDGDAVREKYHKHLGFSPEDIKENNKLILELCLDNISGGNHDYILVPVIAPFLESRKNARSRLGDSYVEVFIDAPVSECIRRDVKGLYAKAVAGEIKNFIGIDPNVPYERPVDPEVHIESMKVGVDDAVLRILKYLTSSQP